MEEAELQAIPHSSGMMASLQATLLANSLLNHLQLLLLITIIRTIILLLWISHIWRLLRQPILRYHHPTPPSIVLIILLSCSSTTITTSSSNISIINHKESIFDLLPLQILLSSVAISNTSTKLPIPLHTCTTIPM